MSRAAALIYGAVMVVLSVMRDESTCLLAMLYQVNGGLPSLMTSFPIVKASKLSYPAKASTVPVQFVYKSIFHSGSIYQFLLDIVREPQKGTVTHPTHRM